MSLAVRLHYNFFVL